ncbi:hypothetical protein GCM10010405_43180 [Streptomyces macrosporus]|uniref:Uncharacterized protein n=1 Tax=Streptomyces macrosporus TaxID=44032 RepID=A0ABN3KF18_9ACTN
MPDSLGHPFGLRQYTGALLVQTRVRAVGVFGSGADVPRRSWAPAGDVFVRGGIGPPGGVTRTGRCGTVAGLVDGREAVAMTTMVKDMLRT